MSRLTTARARGAAGRRRTALRIVVSVVVLLAVAVWLGVGAMAAGRLTVPQRRFEPASHPGTFGASEWRERTLTTRDGISLAAWYLPVDGADVGIVLVHGHEQSRTWEMRQRFPELAVALQAGGYQVVVMDLRGHGASGGERFSFGRLERFDVMAAVDLLVAEGVPPGRVGVLGVSMGAASAIGATADDARIGALWADSGYADIRPILEARWPGASGLPMVFFYGTLLAHRLRFGYPIDGVVPEVEIRGVHPRPIQLVHGTADTVIPYEHGRRLAAASGADLWTIEGGDHRDGFVNDPAGYTARVVAFFDAAVRGEPLR